MVAEEDRRCCCKEETQNISRLDPRTERCFDSRALRIDVQPADHLYVTDMTELDLPSTMKIISSADNLLNFQLYITPNEGEASLASSIRSTDPCGTRHVQGRPFQVHFCDRSQLPARTAEGEVHSEGTSLSS